MPTLIIKTNADLTDRPRDALLRNASAAVAELLGKPEGYVMVLLEPVTDMCFGADTAPCAYRSSRASGCRSRARRSSRRPCAPSSRSTSASPKRASTSSSPRRRGTCSASMAAPLAD